MNRLLIGLLAASLAGGFAHAATINQGAIPDAPGATVITVAGEITSGDADRFRQLVDTTPNRAIVVLDSPGGKVAEAIKIGLIIRARSFVTVVVNHSTCASACGLIWLAGQPRIADHTSRIGFHAAYAEGPTGGQTPDGAGNALVGAYLTQLGLSFPAIYFATSAPPDMLNWLPSNGDIVGIHYMMAEDIAPKARPAVAAAPPAVPVTPSAAPRVASTVAEPSAANVQRPSASADPMMTQPAAVVAPVRQEMIKAGTEHDFVYAHDLLARAPFRASYAAMFRGQQAVPGWLQHYQTGRDGVEMPVWVMTSQTTQLTGFRVCQARACNAAWIDVVFAPLGGQAWALSWADGRPRSWWGQPDEPTQRLLLSLEPVAANPPPMSPAYTDGRQARLHYEQWFQVLPDGPFKDGATFWAAHRSVRPRPPCNDPVQPADWQKGCLAAVTQLAPADVRRSAETDFRWGWNSL